jgi:prepilin-type N-terminal cleavage/methylation domain-containing protein
MGQGTGDDPDYVNSLMYPFPAYKEKLKEKRNQGFTLIEILIVVAIIAILASVVLVGLGPTQAAGRDARRVSDLAEVQNGLQLFYGACGYYPGRSWGNVGCDAGYADPGGEGSFAAGLNAYSAMSNVLMWASNGSLSIGLGINAVPQDPLSHGNYAYEYSTAVRDSYTLGAQLENVDHSAMQSSIQGDAVNDLVGPGGSACGSNGFYCIGL